jgi:hypothetical protein
MIKIRDELELHTWFKKNYKKLGFTDILAYNSNSFPDFIALENGKKVRVEFEINASNFILHKHPISKVDKVICINKDIDLDVSTIELPNFKIVAFNQQTPYSIMNRAYQLFKKSKVLTSIEVSKKLRVSWNTAEKALLELAVENKILRIKKAGVNLWIMK